MNTQEQSLWQSRQFQQQGITPPPNAAQAEQNDSQCIGGEQQPNGAPTAPQGANWDSIPAELRNRPHWCIAASDKSPRMPDGHRASPTDPSTWSDFDTVSRVASKEGLHIGYVLSPDAPFTCIDLDIKDATSKDNKGEFLPKEKHTTQKELDRYRAMVGMFGSYTELSASGKGLHIWVEGDIGPGGRREGVEVYSRERFIICTGNALSDINYSVIHGITLAIPLNHTALPIANKQDLLDGLMNDIRRGAARSIELEEVDATCTDAELWERASNAGNGEKFKNLCAGDYQQYRYPSQSEADLSLMSMFTFYSDSNEQCMRMFRATKLGERKKAQKDDVYLNRTLKLVRSRQASESSSQHGERIAKALLLNLEKQQADKSAKEKARAGSLINVYTPKEYVKRPQVRWTVQGVLPEEGFTAVYGAPGSGKSFLVLDMLAHIAKGKSWFGRRIRRCPVAYMAFESIGGIPQRWQAFEKEHWSTENIRFLEAPCLDLTNATHREALINTLKGLWSEGGVLCIDTLAACAPGIDENSSEGMGKLIAELQMIQSEVGGCLLVVHHSGKDRERGLRGWSGLNGALDASIEVIRSETNRQWRVAKSKDGKDGDIFSFDLRNVIIEHDEFGSPISSCVISAASANTNNEELTTLLLKLIQENYEQGKWISPRPQAANSSWKMLNDHANFPKHLDKKTLTMLLKQAVGEGLLTEELYKNHNRKEAVRWKMK